MNASELVRQANAKVKEAEEMLLRAARIYADEDAPQKQEATLEYLQILLRARQSLTGTSRGYLR